MTERYQAIVDPPWSLQSWRLLARHGWLAQIAPEQLDWGGGEQAGLLPALSLLEAPLQRSELRVPRELLDLAGAVLCHRGPQRHALLYQLLWRIGNGERALLDRATDAQVRRARILQKAVNRDTHKMKAFVRFRQIAGGENQFVAWFEPPSDILDRVAPFFQRRFASMRWSILTPYRSVRWDGDRLHFGSGAQRSDAPADDATESAWRSYYRHIFNPARANPKMMQQEMPRQYWKNLPEAELIADLLNASPERVKAMIERKPQLPKRRIPPRRSE